MKSPTAEISVSSVERSENFFSYNYVIFFFATRLKMWSSMKKVINILHEWVYVYISLAHASLLEIPCRNSIAQFSSKTNLVYFTVILLTLYYFWISKFELQVIVRHETYVYCEFWDDIHTYIYFDVYRYTLKRGFEVFVCS